MKKIYYPIKLYSVIKLRRSGLVCGDISSFLSGRMTALVMSYYRKLLKFSINTTLIYIRFGFVNGGDVVVEPRAQCVECVLKLSNEALKPSNLNRHLERSEERRVGEECRS